MLPDEPNDEERQEELPQDNGTPFQPAAPVPDPSSGAVNDPVAQAASDGTLDDTHPATDTGVQPEGVYEAGVSGEVNAQEPNAGNAVAGYTPPAPGTTVEPSPEQAHESSPPGQDDDTTAAAA